MYPSWLAGGREKGKLAAAIAAGIAYMERTNVCFSAAMGSS